MGHIWKVCYDIFYEAALGTRGPGAQASPAQACRGLNVWTHGRRPSKLGPKWAWTQVIQTQLVQAQVLLYPMPITCEFGGLELDSGGPLYIHFRDELDTHDSNKEWTSYLASSCRGAMLMLLSVARAGAKEPTPYGWQF